MKTFTTRKPARHPAPGCSCRNANTCPLNQACNTEAVVYKPELTSTIPNRPTERKCYIDMVEGRFKQRYFNHTTSFRYTDKRTATTLASHIWKLKDSNAKYNTKWSILERSRPYTNGSMKCQLCTAEKAHILRSLKRSADCLHNRAEFFG